MSKKQFTITQSNEIGKKNLKLSKDELELAKKEIDESKLREAIREELLNEMDFIKLLPIQINNAASQLANLKRSALLYDFPKMKRAYMDLHKQVISMKKTIDGII